MPYTLEVRHDPKLDLAAEMLRSSGTVRLELRGTSMLPSLWPGDLLTIQGTAKGAVAPGDMVLVMRDSRFFVHRLVEKQRIEDRFFWVTKGDSVLRSDPPVAVSELLGRVVGVHRGSRSFVPSREVSLMQASMTWMLRRWDHFRSLALRVHAARIRASSTRTGKFLCGIVPAFRVIRSISVSRTTHP
jgi:signal peptidase I